MSQFTLDKQAGLSSAAGGLLRTFLNAVGRNANPGSKNRMIGSKLVDALNPQRAPRIASAFAHGESAFGQGLAKAPAELGKIPAGVHPDQVPGFKQYWQRFGGGKVLPADAMAAKQMAMQRAQELAQQRLSRVQALAQGRDEQALSRTGIAATLPFLGYGLGSMSGDKPAQPQSQPGMPGTMPQ